MERIASLVIYLYFKAVLQRGYLVISKLLVCVFIGRLRAIEYIMCFVVLMISPGLRMIAIHKVCPLMIVL